MDNEVVENIEENPTEQEVTHEEVVEQVQPEVTESQPEAEVASDDDQKKTSEACSNCSGSGIVGEFVCDMCQGRGVI